MVSWIRYVFDKNYGWCLCIAKNMYKMIFILFNFGLLWLIKKCFNVRNMFDKVSKVIFFMILGEKNGW